MTLPAGLRALRHRNFRLFYLGQGTSQIGFWLQQIATGWLIYKLSGSAFLLGLAAFALQIPFLVLAPLAGVYLDRLDRRRVLVTTNCVAFLQASAMFALVAAGEVQPWHLVAANLVLGVVSACDAPARQSILVELVGGKADLPNAIALNSTMMNAARFVGPLVGGGLIAALGERWSYGINALTYLWMLGMLSRMQLPPRPRLPAGAGLVHELAAGARYAYGFLPTRSALLLLAATSLTVQSYAAQMPWFAREAFHGDSRTLGMLVGAGGLGAVSGMVYLANRPDIRGLLRLAGTMSATGGCALIAFSFSTSLWLALPALYFVGMGAMLTAASINTVLQSIVPDELRGRVASFYVMSFLGIAPLGALASGVVAERIGPPHTMAACGVLALAAAATYFSQFGKIRRDIRAAYERLGILAKASKA
ncbi:MAG: MFS transporter [Betaproteobacteria bacterium]|nr:MFS transporter [Betaproteobacteria bacterium]